MLLPNQEFYSNIYNTVKATSNLPKASAEPEHSTSESTDDDVELTFPHRNGFDFPTASSSISNTSTDFISSPSCSHLSGNIFNHR